MKIFFGADIVPTVSNIKFFRDNDVEALVGVELKEKLEACDYRVFNLETPICSIGSPIAKCGPVHEAPISTMRGISGLGCNLLSLANNHILDQGPKGLEETVDLLVKYGISWVGAKNKQILKKTHIFDSNGVRVGIYACAEHEFSIYTDHTSGAVPYDPLVSFDDVELLKNHCDYVVVLFHGGKEYYRYPSPNNQKIARHFIEKGACLVLFQHSHCIGCIEKYMEGTIVYGQGNFLFDSDDGEFGRTSIGVISNFGDNDINLEIVPLVNQNGTTRLAKDKEQIDILSRLELRSREIMKENFVETNYKMFSMKKAGEYLVVYSGNAFILRVIRKIFGDKCIINMYNKKNLLRIKNFSKCEAHSELFQSIVDTILEGKK